MRTVERARTSKAGADDEIPPSAPRPQRSARPSTEDSGTARGDHVKGAAGAERSEGTLYVIEHAVTLASVDEAAALFANDAPPTTTIGSVEAGQRPASLLVNDVAR